jgi:hypothetical protein
VELDKRSCTLPGRRPPASSWLAHVQSSVACSDCLAWDALTDVVFKKVDRNRTCAIILFVVMNGLCRL